MLETAQLRLDKARYDDWEEMYRNVWSRPECARYMLWSLTVSPEEARARILRTIEFQKTHDTYLVYEKAAGRAIGFAGVEETAPGVCSEAGICLGPEFFRRGYGRQLLLRLMDYARERYDAREFLCFAREENIASNGLIRSLGFNLMGAEERVDERDGSTYRLLRYQKTLVGEGQTSGSI